MYIHREIEKEIAPFLKSKEVLSIIGPRQAGKTTFLKYLMSCFQEEKKSVKFITFENRSDLELFNNIEDFKELNKKYEIIIIDEFQYARQGGQKLKYLFDTTNIKYIISGSSSLEIKFQTGKYMVGRMFNFTLLPFSFREFLEFYNKELFELLSARFALKFSFDKFQAKDAFGTEVNSRLTTLFEKYIIFGGYPAAVIAKTEEEKQKIIESILENYLLKDIKSLLQIADENELINVVKLLAAQIGNLIEYKELSNGSGVNHKTILKYLDILKQTYIIGLIKPYFTNKRTEIVKNPKVYFFDSGFRNFILSDFRKLEERTDTGSLAENYGFTALKRNSGLFQNLNFWRTKSKAEVDFVVSVKNKIVPIEVKYSLNPVIGKSLYSFIEKFSPAQAIILTKGFIKEEKIKKCKVKFIPIYYL